MSAEILREAAELMRADALAMQADGDWKRGIAKLGRWTIKGLYFASWHPAVALAVADWLDDEAESWESEPSNDGIPYFRAYMVATAYLGSDA